MPGPNVNPTDVAVATMINTTLKACAAMSTKSATECTSPDLRRTFMELANDDVERQARLATMLNRKGIYVAPPVSEASVNMVVPQLQAAMTGIGTDAVVGNNVTGAFAGEISPRGNV